MQRARCPIQTEDDSDAASQKHPCLGRHHVRGLVEAVLWRLLLRRRRLDLGQPPRRLLKSLSVPHRKGDTLAEAHRLDDRLLAEGSSVPPSDVDEPLESGITALAQRLTL